VFAAANDAGYGIRTRELLRDGILRSDPVLDKSPTTAVIMGLLGLLPGYWYIGRLWKRGVVVIILGLLLSFTGIGVFIVWGAGIYDIYKLAKNEPAPFDILNKWDLG